MRLFVKRQTTPARQSFFRYCRLLCLRLVVYFSFGFCVAWYLLTHALLPLDWLAIRGFGSFYSVFLWGLSLTLPIPILFICGVRIADFYYTSRLWNFLFCFLQGTDLCVLLLPLLGGASGFSVVLCAFPVALTVGQLSMLFRANLQACAGVAPSAAAESVTPSRRQILRYIYLALGTWSMTILLQIAFCAVATFTLSLKSI